MTADNDPQPLNSDTARAQLDEGLRSCRTVVQNYRMMLTGDFGDLQAANDEDEPDRPRSTDA